MAKPRTKDCPIVGFLEVFGDYWTWLIIREAFYGTTRFGDFQRNTGIAKNLLADRLDRLVDREILEKRDVGRLGTRFAYHLTPSGEALQTTLLAMYQWSNEHFYGADKAPVEMRELSSGKPLAHLAVRDAEGRPLTRRDLI
ncbi:MAG: helix-turn-helix domain-containing protein, partial [Pseudomonadota bacterium]